MSAPTAIARVGRLRRAPRHVLEEYRDDGPLAQAVGALAGRVLRLPPFVPLALAAAGLLALAAVEGDAASDGLVAAGVGWVVVLGAISSGSRHTDRFAWTAPGLLRVAEYGGFVWIASNVGGAGPAAAFALIAALTFRHYDLVYRSRYQGVAPPAWLQVVGLGWDGRLLLALALMLAGALPAGMFVLAGVLGVLFVWECARSWAGLAGRPVSVYEDEEDEGQ